MRLLIVSNRLPVTVMREGDSLRFQESVGGLASGLRAYMDNIKSSRSPESQYDYAWVGWPGVTIDESLRDSLRYKLSSEFHAYPVFLSEKSMDKFYHGFSNKTIWPLFHYFTSHVQYDEDFWDQYRQVNETFCDAVTQIAKPGDLIWIHDYHLMLLPKLIRERAPDVSLGFFLHIPFPSFEVFRLLPSKWRREILEGLLGADLIGFHTYDYTHYFLRCVQRILGFENNMGQIIADDHIVRADIFPMGIDFQKFKDAAVSPKVEIEKEDLKTLFAGRKVIISIDRLDYTKGIINRLQGFELFLKKNPQWHGKVVLVLVVVPSRTKVEHYQQMKRQIDEIVGKINGRCGSMNWMPIRYHYKFLPFNLLVALYSVSDVALVTPLRDGMNLIAKEYIATKADGKGVLILSEMAGASKEAGETIVINPNDIGEIADTLKAALEMPEEEQIRCNRAIQARLKRHDVTRWADDFIQTLISMQEEQKKMDARLLGQSSKEKMRKDFREAKRRLILLDYDGTLVPIARHPKMATPTVELMEFLDVMSREQKTDVVLISGRNRNELQSWFGDLGISLVAEHGVWIREKGEDWKMLKPLNNEWKQKILPLLEMHTDRLSGSFVEEKEYSLAWHYRMADPEMASIVAKELVDDLVNFTANIDVQVLQGNKVVEVRNAGLNKGDAGMYCRSKGDFDFILAVGDDWTDEDLFKVLPETAYSIRIGMTQSYARFNLHNCSEVIKLVRELTDESKP
ncbi:MAG TPA: bifunctional alpha,alpha-trehalose-phosphate synthase (UDP-forming)/trehalose-phosphatase [Methanotrichaceae archaeon]|nr:bifunctional alpha,alpha-trehalose-phosphate synthase (UDP-forming)/trehalose-phosphatase [Methanotrichaceae archaeon]